MYQRQSLPTVNVSRLIPIWIGATLASTLKISISILLSLSISISISISISSTAAIAYPSLWPTDSSSGSQNFGMVSSQIHRIQDLLENSQKSLSNSDFFDFSARLKELKDSASVELSRGADASSLQIPLQNLEREINSRGADIAQQNLSKKHMLEMNIMRLERELKSKSSDLSQEDWSSFFYRLSELKAKVLKSVGASDEAIEQLSTEARDIESKMMDKVMFAPRKGGLTFTREDPPGDKPKSEVKKPISDKAESDASESHALTETKTTVTTVLHLQKKPPAPIPKIMEQIENRLIDYHEKHQIGSFDMDSFTDRLLAQKKNLHVMLSKTGHLSLRQEALIRQELDQLQEELTNRVSGKD